MPKSPDGKLASPRLCLKFHRDHLGTHTSQKSRDSTYSVTTVSVAEGLDNPMFSPVDSPASSIEGDMYHPHLEHLTNFSGSRVKITIPEDENSCSGYEPKQNSEALLMTAQRTLSAERMGNMVTREVFPDQGVLNSETNNTFPSLLCTSSDNQVTHPSVLKTSETLPFKPNSQFSLTQNDEDSLGELPSLEIDTSDTIPSKGVNNTPYNDVVNMPECNTVSSSNINDANQILPSQSNVSSSTESPDKSHSSQVTASNHDPVGIQQASSNLVTSDCVSQTNLVTESVLVSNPESHNAVTNTSEALPSTSDSCTNSKLDISQSTSSLNDVDSVEVESDSAKPCSPSRTDRESRDSRPSSPKVPPLKIIIPPKSQPSSTASEHNEGLKLVVTNVKSALPYVINPYQDQGSEAEALVENPDMNVNQHWPINHIFGHASSQPVSQSHHGSLLSSSVAPNFVDLNSISSFSVKGESASENVDMEVDGEGSATNNGNVNEVEESDKFLEQNEDSGSNSSDLDGKQGDKKEEPTKRVLRSALRSQQHSSTDAKPPKQPKTEKSDKVEKSDRSSEYLSFGFDL